MFTLSNTKLDDSVNRLKDISWFILVSFAHILFRSNCGFSASINFFCVLIPSRRCVRIKF